MRDNNETIDDLITATEAGLVKLKTSQQGIETYTKGKELEQRPKRPILSVSQLRKLPPLKWIVPGIMPDRSFGVIWGEPGTRKSFAALDLACSLVTGKPFLNYFTVTERKKVLYVYSEGLAGANSRLSAWEQARAASDADLAGLMFSPHSYNLPDEVPALLADIADTYKDAMPDVIVIDTLARNFSGDENSTKDMKDWSNAITDLVNNGTSVVIVHHSGKDMSKGMRGSIALKGACDWAIGMGADQICEITKMKDGRMPPSFRIEPVEVELGDGQTSLALRYAGNSTADDMQGKQKQKQTAIAKAIAQHGQAGANRSEIMDATDMSKTTLHTHLTMMKERGELYNEDQGSKGGDVWHLTTKGEEIYCQTSPAMTLDKLNIIMGNNSLN